MADTRSEELLIYTTEIVTAVLSNSEVGTDDLPALISNISAAVSSLGGEAEAVTEKHEPAVPVARSITPDYLVCLEDGKKMKLLKRYLRSKYDMTPEEYRARWDLPGDYPMVAPNYATTRKRLAMESGLGRQKAEPAPTNAKRPAAKEAVAPAPTPVKTAPETPAAAAPAPVAKPAPPKEAPAARAKLKPVFRATPEPTLEEPKAAPAPTATSARATLSARPRPADIPPVSADQEGAEHQDILCQAIASRTCIRTIYNKKDVVLAPYIVYTRNDELFMRAVTIEHDGRPPRELKLGTFKLVGLGQVSMTTRQFTQQFHYNPRDAQYAGKTVCSLL